MNKRIMLIVFAIILLFLGGFFYFRYQIYNSHGVSQKEQVFEIKKGEGTREIGARLKEAGIIARENYFYIYLKAENLSRNILPGIYMLSGNMKISEVAYKITQEQDRRIKVTFPEGWTGKEMAERLNENGLDGDGFLKFLNQPEKFWEKHEFLKDPEIKSLEGYLFPDTYFLKKDILPENIISMMLNNFEEKITGEMQSDITSQGKTIREAIVLSSVIEMEVKTEEDRKIVSGIFWKRLKNFHPLQSCATLAYALGEKKKQYSFDDTRVNSPYNTYINQGLPVGPIGNPGISSIKAAIYPEDSDYFYFLSDPETGKTIFSRTIEEHNQNKAKYGL